MPKRERNLCPQIANFSALVSATRRAALGKKTKPGAAAFLADREKECLALERALLSGEYRPGRYVKIELFDPKHRIVSAAPFRDRVVHHAVCAVVEPIFERGFIAHTFANRRGKGAHRAVEAYERYRDRCAYVLRCDIFRYFPAIDHAILKRDLRRRLACERTLGLLDCIIDASNRQELVELHFPGDDLFAPVARRRGLPIGNLTSQFFANLYLDPLDHFCTEVLRAPYVRYVDDFALFHDDPAILADWRDRIARFLEGRRLKLHTQKTWVAPTAEPAEFLCYVLAPKGVRRLPEATIRRFRHRLRSLRDQLSAGTTTEADAHVRIEAWEAHANFAHTRKLRNAVLGERKYGKRILG
ncbi:MAG: RNA-directed DNA polymerase [Pseudomonadota bacterium]